MKEINYVNNKTTGELLSEARKKKGYSQRRVGSFLGISAGAYSKIETGVNSLKAGHMKKLSKILDIGFDDLLASCGISENEYREKLATEEGVRFDTENITIGKTGRVCPEKKLINIGIDFSKINSFLSFAESIVCPSERHTYVETTEILLLTAVLKFCGYFVYPYQWTWDSVERLVSASIRYVGDDDETAFSAVIERIRTDIVKNNNFNDVLHYHAMFEKMPDAVRREAAANVFYKIHKFACTDFLESELFFESPRHIREDEPVRWLGALFWEDYDYYIDAGIKTIGDITSKSASELTDIISHEFVITDRDEFVEDIRCRLSKFGLRLKNDVIDSEA